jgi:hypothetical protein
MVNHIAWLFGVTLVATSCAKKTKNPETYQAPAESADAAPRIFYEPTRPDGGLTPFKASEMPPEEIARRKAKNEVAPIIFGLSAGGISMQTPSSDADKILAPALGISFNSLLDVSLAKDYGLTFGGYLVYPERIAVLWSETRAMTPSVIRVMAGQPGQLSLVDPVGTGYVGDSLARVFGPNPTEEALRGYVRKLGAAIEKRASDYNCEEAKTCRISYLDANEKTIIDLEFKKGFLRLMREGGDIRLMEAVFHKDALLPARLSEPLDYELGKIGPFSTSSTRTEVQARLGNPMAEDVYGLLYDRNALILRKESTPTPGQIKLRALIGYQGSLDLGATVGPRFLGDSFADLAPVSENGHELMLFLDRILEKREPEFDCRTAPTPCRALVEFDPYYNANLLVFELPKGSFRFSRGAARIWMGFEPK